MAKYDFKFKNKKIPIILLNARITQKSFYRWKVLGKFSTKRFFNVLINHWFLIMKL